MVGHMQNEMMKFRFDSYRSKLCGFTIVELLLVVVVIALIGGLGGGLWLGTYNRMQVDKAARSFSLAAKYAKMAAIERQMPCRLLLDKENKKFSLLVYETNERSGKTQLVPFRERPFSRPVELGANVEFEHIRITSLGESGTNEKSNQSVIVFAPNGTAQEAVVQIGDGKNHYTASISAATGRVKMIFGTATEVKTGTIDLDMEGG